MRALRTLLRDTRGVMAIETTIVAPVLALMAIGTFEAGTMVSRQQELQSAASEAEGIILATASVDGGLIDLPGIKNVIEDSLGSGETRPNLVVNLGYRFRCGTAAELVAERDSCADPDNAYFFVLVDISDRYDPVWTRFGIADGFDYNVSRTVQVQ